MSIRTEIYLLTLNPSDPDFQRHSKSSKAARFDQVPMTKISYYLSVVTVGVSEISGDIG